MIFLKNKYSNIPTRFYQAKCCHMPFNWNCQHFYAKSNQDSFTVTIPVFTYSSNLFSP